MINQGLIELSIEWYPDASNDIITIFHIHLKPDVDQNAVNTVFRKYLPNMFFAGGIQQHSKLSSRVRVDKHDERAAKHPQNS